MSGIAVRCPLCSGQPGEPVRLRFRIVRGQERLIERVLPLRGEFRLTEILVFTPLLTFDEAAEEPFNPAH